MKRSDMRTILLQTFLLVSAVTLGLTSIIFSTMQYRTLKEDVTQDMQTDCNTIAESLDQNIQGMDTILLYTIASRELRDSIAEYKSATDAFSRNKSKQELLAIMLSLKGFDFTIRQLNCYDMEKGGFGAGNYNGELDVCVPGLRWYERTVENSGRRHICDPAQDSFVSHAAGIDEETMYFSICRMFYDDMHVPAGFVEVKKYYDDVFDPKILMSGENGTSVVVYDSGGRQLYPEGQVFDYYRYKDMGEGEIENAQTGKKQFLCFSDESHNGIIVSMAVDNSSFMAPVYRSLLGMVIGVLIIFMVAVFIAYKLSARISRPIIGMYRFLSDRRDRSFEKLEMEDTGIKEIDSLRDSINESIAAQEAATTTMLTLKEQEMQARMLALQSQMNPHFLYNSLSTIGEMADEGHVDQVSDMCGDITSILRYISSDQEQRIRVEEEMEQVDRYLSCMKRRYGEELNYRFDIEDDILDCMVPKLCIQLLVENAIKSVTTRKSPWVVTVEGKIKDNGWYVTVRDNGPGFDPQVDKRLRKNMDEILETGVLPSLGIEGMGLLNIFIRLYLLDGIPFIFDFGNNAEGGAYVTIGGYIRDKG